MWFSILTLIAITAMNVVGLNIGKWLHNIGSFGMWVPVLILVVIGIYAWKSFGSATSFTLENLMPSTHLKDMLFWASLTYAFGGCETGSFMAEEIKDSRRTIPLAVFLAGLAVTFCYIGGTIAVLLAFPAARSAICRD